MMSAAPAGAPGNLWRRSSFKNHPRSRGWGTWRRSRLAEISGWGARFRKAISGCIQKEWSMRIQPLMLGALGALALAACSQQEEIAAARSEEHTSELQSLMRISYAVFCLKKKKTQIRKTNITIKQC